MKRKVKYVFVEINDRGDVIRVIKTAKLARLLPVESVREIPKADAIRSIRLGVYERCKERTGYAECEWCSKPITWQSMEMHEKIFKGKRDENGNYGEVSLENSVGICHDCHQGPNGAHGDRRWQLAKNKDSQWTQ